MAAVAATVATTPLVARANDDTLNRGLQGPRPDEQPSVGWSIDAGTPALSNDARPGTNPDDARAVGADESAIPLGVPRAHAAQPANTAVNADASPESSEPLGGDASGADSLTSGAIRTIGALSLVVALILALAWVYKRVIGGRALGRFGARAPSGLVEVLARYPLPPRHSLVVLRFGQRVLLVSHGAKGGDLTTLCQLDDPGEVAGVLEIVRETEGRSINARFREAISEADELFESALERTPAVEWAQERAAYTDPEPDRSELLDTHDVSPLRRRLDAMRGGVYA